MSTFNFKTKPYDHQLDILKTSYDKRYWALFMEMGTGKSKVSIDTMSALFDQKEIKAALIIAPKGVYDNWVEKEIPTHLACDYHIVRWTPSKSKKFTEELRTICLEEMDSLKIFVMNIEALSTDRAFLVAEYYLRHNPENMVIIDESTTIKGRTSKRTKNCIKLRDVSKYRRILTGSPVTNSPLDLFSQCAFLSKLALGDTAKSYNAFSNRYANIVRMQGSRGFYPQVTGYRNLDELNKIVDSFSSRVLKQECLDLPDKVYEIRKIEFTAEQKSMYAQMHKYALAQFDSGEMTTTANVLTQIIRLQQICCGFLQPDEGEIQPLPNNRMPELLNVLSETQGKVIIWCTFTHDIINIKEELEKQYGSASVAAYYGATPQDERQEIVTRFQDPDNPLRFFIGQPSTAGYGITLTEANTVIYYSNSYNLEHRLQSEDRAHRIGQTSKVTYIDFIIEKTIEVKIIKALRAKINLAEAVLGEGGREWLL